jgi:hypothetical protein
MCTAPWYIEITPAGWQAVPEQPMVPSLTHLPIFQQPIQDVARYVWLVLSSTWSA